MFQLSFCFVQLRYKMAIHPTSTLLQKKWYVALEQHDEHDVHVHHTKAVCMIQDGRGIEDRHGSSADTL